MVPSSKDNLIEGVCFIPIYYLVIILFLTDATVLRILFIRSCAVKKPFCLSFYILPLQDVSNLCFCP
jgi:hypothetical protein